MYRPSHISSSDPTVNDDYANGFHQGNFWWNRDDNTLFFLERHTTGAAVWVKTTGAVIGSWANWTPTFIWTGNTPVGVGYVARYVVIGNMVNFTLDVTGHAGASGDLTNMECTLPVTPIDLDNLVPIIGYQVYGATWQRACIPYIDGTRINDVDRKLYHGYFSTISPDQEFRLMYEGFYEQKTE